ncbi:hypothetical protein EER27_01980 [Lysobacter psychrotolerans]|uniref:Uncharacterized protein n=1 Tax=Montanilutibacter psychrotolerans TaxID=1327343 RepID=A0A3M8T418_9GAMM|nr:hypothetical protein EER27_01980 [Lysobacter psychrotolerans]
MALKFFGGECHEAVGFEVNRVDYQSTNFDGCPLTARSQNVLRPPKNGQASHLDQLRIGIRRLNPIHLHDGVRLTKQLEVRLTDDDMAAATRHLADLPNVELHAWCGA